MAGDESLAMSMHKKMAPPLVTLLSTEAELQYVALRNINLIVHKYPQILAHEVKVFFCKYNDPIYVKMVGSTFHALGPNQAWCAVFQTLDA